MTITGPCLSDHPECLNKISTNAPPLSTHTLLYIPLNALDTLYSTLLDKMGVQNAVADLPAMKTNPKVLASNFSILGTQRR